MEKKNLSSNSNGNGAYALWGPWALWILGVAVMIGPPVSIILVGLALGYGVRM